MTPYYEQDGITIYHADVLEAIHHINADITITDPPYNVGMAYPTNDRLEDYEAWCAEWLSLMPRPLVFTPGTMNLAMWYRIEEPHWQGAWYKPASCSPSRLGGFNVWEPVLVYGKPTKRVGHDAWAGFTGNNKQTDTSIHPCPKTLPFMRALIRSFTNAGDVILDPFMGSGTTLRAAKDLGRRAVGIEINEEYCQIAVKRLRQSVLPFEAVT